MLQKCPSCGNPLHFTYNTYEIKNDYYNYQVRNSIFWKCDTCQYCTIDDTCKTLANKYCLKIYNDKNIENMTIDFRKFMKYYLKETCQYINYDNTKEIKFTYDFMDYYFIEGLYRPFNIGFLTPVYFSRNVLSKYIDNPDYIIKYTSNNTIIIIENENFHITLGINANNKIIAWLGDLYDLPKNEQYYFKSENIDSDHNIASEFYNSQIDLIWPQNSNEQSIFCSLHKLNKLINGLTLFNLNKQIANDFSIQIHPPEYNTVKKFGVIMNSLNKILVERINTKGIKQFLKINYSDTLPKDYKTNGSIKTLQLLLTIYSDKNNIDININKLISPLYVLYDLRILANHTYDSSAEETFIECMKRLSLDPDTDDYMQIYKTLIEHLKLMFETLEQKL